MLLSTATAVTALTALATLAALPTSCDSERSRDAGPRDVGTIVRVIDLGEVIVRRDDASRFHAVVTAPHACGLGAKYPECDR